MCETILNLDYSDPNTWPKLDDLMRLAIVEHRPEQVDVFKFPKDCNQRRFFVYRYKRVHVDG